MIVDTSALLAIFYQEPESAEFEALILGSMNVRISALSVLEAGLSVRRRLGQPGIEQLILLIEELGLTVEPFQPGDVALALEADRRFGKGAHQARLNFGDCCAYALAARTAAPILYKGDDFALTDLEAAR